MDAERSFHIVFCMSAAGLVRQCLRAIGCNEAVIGLPDDLMCGPIGDIHGAARREWLAQHIGRAGALEIEDGPAQMSRTRVRRA